MEIRRAGLAPVIPLRSFLVRAYAKAHDEMVTALAHTVLGAPRPAPGTEAVWFVLQPDDFLRPVVGRRVSPKRDLQSRIALLIAVIPQMGMRASIRRLSRRSRSFAVFVRAPK